MFSRADIQINPELNLSDYAALLKENGRVQIPNFFTDETAETLHNLIKTNQTWNLAYNEYDQFFESTKQDFEDTPAEFKTNFMKAIYERASSTFQYVFMQYYITQAVKNREEMGHPLHELHHWANEDDFLSLLKSLVGDSAIRWCDVFISRYEPGHFLSKHDDTHPKHDRSVAYTIGMTKEWNPNWGGHLVFLDKKGGIKEGFIPEFNTLNLFHNPQDHAVQLVAPNAGKPRDSFLGWANR
ncbi:2OG-Fe(II) oxygenase family protein [Temperatibacter marinus]|uniref:2OG-Fe(II) oxygenase family protein n=1 Tax=Temperatibacter marinus TaxID=1456591 RepID=A0AA52EEJ9_9PROT|nr:2OG-Fe(II) oxygenase family protein [Temperatibacter marinus]WND01638.1 2OG-Fe(II) oxygenase family protein [Temperatibacter marinus]